MDLADKAGSLRLFQKAALNAGKVYGIGIPFTNKLIIPLAKKPARVLSMLGHVGKTAETFGETALKEALPSAMPAILKTVEKGKIGIWADRLLSRFGPAKFIQDAFAPWRQAHVKAILTKLDAQNKIGTEFIEIDKMFMKLGKEQDHATGRFLFGVMENRPYQNAKTVAENVEFSKYVGRIMARTAKGETLKEATEKVFKKRQDLYDLFKSRTAIEENLKPAEIFKRYSDMLDETSARQIRGLMARNGFETEDLTQLAGFKPKTDWKTIWKEYGKPLKVEEKESLMKFIDYIDAHHAHLWDEEFKMGIIKNYK
jgi:phosphoglycolate phosphatase-like HAD superfamily hydrolase